jgi:predicted transposase YbfD/YdcC
LRKEVEEEGRKKSKEENEMRYIIKQLRKVKDVRQAWKTKHSLEEILAISIAAMICGADSISKIVQFAQLRERWLKKYLPLPNGIPHRLTIWRTLSALNPSALEEIFNRIMKKLQKVSAGAVVALDGKKYFTETGEDNVTRMLYIVNAWNEANGLTLGQVRTQEKSNEIKAIPELLRILKIRGSIVTIDAAGCQKEIVKTIIKKNKADYCIALKRNQGTMHCEMMQYAQDCIADPLLKNKYVTLVKQEKGHGRIEIRKYHLFTDLSWFEDIKKWEGLKSLVVVESTRIIKGKTTTEVRYYISSLTDIESAANAVRSHWGVENKLHWRLDVVLGEDGWKVASKNLAANLDVLRKLALAFLRKMDFGDTGSDKLSGPMKMWACALSLDTLDAVISGRFPAFSDRKSVV